MGGWMNIWMVGIQWFGKVEHSKNISCLQGVNPLIIESLLKKKTGDVFNHLERVQSSLLT